MRKKKRKPKINKKSSLKSIATLTTKSISNAFIKYKRNKELEKIKTIKLQKIE